MPTPSDPCQPVIVGIGGTVGGLSSTERALRIALAAASEEGFSTRLFGGDDLARLPIYGPRETERQPAETAFVDAIRGASGLIIASPGYHGSISGLVKNALDLLEETARDPARPYLTDLPVGLIATAYGHQAMGSTIAAMRSVVHALRGWPTPFAAAVNSSAVRLGDDASANDATTVAQLQMVGQQVARFISQTALAPYPPGSDDVPEGGDRNLHAANDVATTNR